MNAEIKLKDTKVFVNFEQQKREQKRLEMATNWSIASEIKEVPPKGYTKIFDDLD